MMIKIRPFTGSEQDYNDRVALENAVWPEYIETVEGLRHSIESQSADQLTERFMLDWDGHFVGHGMYRRSKAGARQDVYRIHVIVHPDFRRRGIGRHFFEFATEAIEDLDPKPALMQATTREDQIAATAWLDKLGYKKAMRHPVSSLDVQGFDASPFAGLADKMIAEGIEIKTLVALREEDPKADYKLWELVEHHVVPDMPSLHEHVIRPFEEVQKSYFSHPEHRPDGNFVALHQGEYVGISSVWGKADPTMLFVGITGTKKGFRRKGIATALKLYTIAYAQEHGMEKIETDNEENNPMFEINVKLGFVKQPAWAEFEKSVDTESEG